jgi:phosphoglycolate phosphatase-like HAD superfamily hydrolase
MKLVVFDIDGTLTQGTSHFETCFLRAVRLEFGVDGLSPRLRDYPLASDSGILRHILISRLGREASPVHLDRFKARYLGLLVAQMTEARGVPGAREAMAWLDSEAGWKLALATGNWHDAGRAKMKAAGLDGASLPLAGAEDAESREAILRTSLLRAQVHYGRERFERTVYVGDGPWDVEAAREVGLPFVGLEGKYGAELRRMGASHVLPDFTDFAALETALREATLPLAR